MLFHQFYSFFYPRAVTALGQCSAIFFDLGNPWHLEKAFMTLFATKIDKLWAFIETRDTQKYLHDNLGCRDDHFAEHCLRVPCQFFWVSQDFLNTQKTLNIC